MSQWQRGRWVEPRQWVRVDGRWFELMETGRYNVVVCFLTGPLFIVPKSEVQGWKID